MPTLQQIEAARTPAGGWTRKQLAEWGVPWPPPKRWKAALAAKEEAMDQPKEPELVSAQPDVAGEVRKADEAQRKMMLQLVNMAGATFAPWRQHMMEQGASPNSDTLLAAAVAIYAGTIMGELIGMGVLQEAALDNVLDSLRGNMVDGAAAGKLKVARVAEKVLADEAMQQGTGTKQ